MTKKDFVHLHVHSEFSLQDSLLQTSDVVALAKRSGMWAAALTDVHNLFGAVKFYQAACKAGIKPIIGCELRMYATHDMVSKQPLETPLAFRLIVLCQNAKGYKHLSCLLTRSYQSARVHGVAVVLPEWLQPENCEGLIAIEPGVHGYSAKSQLNDLQQLVSWQALFPGRYYLGLHRLGRVEEYQWEMHLAGLNKACKVPLVALGGVCFAEPEDYQAHEVRVCIQSSQVLESRLESEYSKEQYWREGARMCDLYSDLPSAVHNALEIAKRCTVLWRFDQTFLPNFPVPSGYQLESFLEREVMAGLERRGLVEKTPGPYQERVEIELGIINRMGFAGYFLIVADFIQWSKAHHIPVGPGRGSGAGSLAAFCLGITDIDPLPHGLLFERFLNPERVSMPDFDVDFCMLGRDRVIAYVSDKYGKESVAQIITHGSMAAKASVRDVGRVLSHPYGFVDKLAKLIPLDLGITLSAALKQSPELATRYESEMEVKVLLDRALSLEGRVRNVGRHAGGVVISPGALTDFCALYAEESESQQVTHLDMGDIERVGLVKFDFLGLRTLTIIDQAVKWIVEAGLVESLDMNAIALDDVKTFQLLRSGKTTAVFQLESRGFQELITRLSPDVFADIVALVALYRPGPLQSGMVEDFIERKHGRQEVVYAHPCVESLLKETYGVIVYQEQVMQIAQAMAGYTLGAADLLRRAMGKKKPEEMAKQRDIFLKGSKEKEIEVETAEYVFDLMEKFTGYGFNKSHSVAYAFISYQTAYLKAHFLDYFMASVLSSDMDNTDKVVFYMQDCIEHGVKILPPCIHASRAHFYVESAKVIRFALGAIKGVGEGMAMAIRTSFEEKGAFADMLDLAVRLPEKMNKKVLEALIAAGALDVLGQERGVLLGSIEKVLAQKDQYMRSQKIGQGDLFASTDTKCALQACVYGHAVPNWSLKQKLLLEHEAVGWYFSGHPLDPYLRELHAMNKTPLAQVMGPKSKKGIQVAGVLTKTRRMSTKAGRAFLLMEIMDKSGCLEFACFDDKSLQAQQAMEEHQVLVVEGNWVPPRDGAGQGRFNVQRVRSLLQWRLETCRGVRVILTKTKLRQDTLEALRSYAAIQTSHTVGVELIYQGDNWRMTLEAPLQIRLDDAALFELESILKEHDVIWHYK